jgi:murein DD-endopeptidase MepM/ murein hydrolase activator NlpD
LSKHLLNYTSRHVNFLKINHARSKFSAGRVSTSGRSMGSTASQPRWNARYSGYAHEPRARQISRSAGITIAHAGRQIRLGPVAFWIAVGTVIVMAGWSITTATYFAFRDDVLKELMARQAEQQYAYEDRIAELRARIDRTTSRQLLDQEQFEQKLDDLLRRQSTLESRASALSGISDTTGALRPSGRNAQESLTSAPPGRERRSALEHDSMAGRGNASDVGLRLAHLSASLDRVEQRQQLALAHMQERYEGKARKLRGVLADLGLRLEDRSASGGPFVPIRLPGDANGFERALIRIKLARAEADELSRSLVSIPIRKPIAGEIDISSTFGARSDPFLRVPAMHTGIDFRGEIGEPVYATAAGTVATAGWSGGYGRMVEIDHGNGLSTRYGHLSEITVSVGEKVRIGQEVGRMGSTGRSTGPHLHYETRVDGEAVDPQKFLDAGARLYGANKG